MPGMRKLALLALLVAGAALAAGVTLTPSVRYELTDCAAGGSSSVSVTGGSYLFRVTESDTWVCWAATCAAGGEKFPAGAMLLLNVPATQAFSCRSADSKGDVIFTRGQ
jgi:hypothetical protein